MRPARLTAPSTSNRPARAASRLSFPTEVVVQLQDSLAEVKPHLRGWLHLGLVPLTLVGGIVLVALSPDGATRVGSAVFVSSALLLFGVSAVYHRGTWSVGTWRVLRRLDHCNIFVLIAGSCTAYALLLLDRQDTLVVLAVAWSSALAGVAARFAWPDAPRWVSPPLYLASGLAPVLFLPGFLAGASRLGDVGGATLVLLGTGAALYLAGAVVYGFRRPDPWPRWFGFHEVFHTFTVLAFASHYAGILLATYSLR